jgi:hypothetical protein
MKTEYSVQEQIETKFVLGHGGQYAVNLNEENSHYQWLFKLGGGGFYSLRKATEEELNNARRQLHQIAFFKDAVLPTEIKACNCRSYNLDIGSTPEVIMVWPWGDSPDFDYSVAIDACISHVIRRLWDAGINTQNSCCGHNKEKPSIIFDENSLSKSRADEIRKIIKEVDDRDFDIICWERKTY